MYARRSWALAAQRAISLAALRADGLGATLAELARQLDTWVGLFDGSGVLTREHPAPLPPETAQELDREVAAVLRRGARAGSALTIGGTPFTLQTLGRGGHLRGVIAIAGGDLDQEGRTVITAVIAMAGLALEQNEGISRARGSMRAGLVRSLLSGETGLARRIARDLWGSFPQAPLEVAVTTARSTGVDAVTEFLEARAEDSRGSVFFGRSGDDLIVAVPAGERAVLDDLAARFGLRVGISAPAGYDAFGAAVEQARTARDRGSEALTVFGAVGHVGVLSALSADARPLALAQLQPVLDHDAGSGTQLLLTLQAWLDADCSHETCARALGVHRHTVRSRLGLIEQLLGRDLASFATRAELWAALRALD
jgi:purine catabolism regulator